MHRPPKWPGHLRGFRQTPTLNGNAHRSGLLVEVHGSWVGPGEPARANAGLRRVVVGPVGGANRVERVSTCY